VVLEVILVSWATTELNLCVICKNIDDDDDDDDEIQWSLKILKSS